MANIPALFHPDSAANINLSLTKACACEGRNADWRCGHILSTDPFFPSTMVAIRLWLVVTNVLVVTRCQHIAKLRGLSAFSCMLDSWL